MHRTPQFQRPWRACICVLFIIFQASYAAPNGSGGSITSLNQGWLFGGEYTAQSETSAFDDSAFEQITIPHVVSPLGWENWDNNTWNKVWTYRRHIDVPPAASLQGARTFIDFDGVLTIASVTFNGHALTTHRGGYLPFSLEVTGLIKPKGNLLAVIVDSRWSYVNPEGSPLGPKSVDYLEPGGINRDVRLRIEPVTFISDVFAKPTNVLEPQSRSVAVECTIDSSKVQSTVHIKSQLLDGDKTVSQSYISQSLHSKQQVFNLAVAAGDAKLWSPDSPKLYRLITTITAEEVTHSFTRTIGFREAKFTTEGFFLNGENLKIFGLNRHQLYPFVGMAAPERLQKQDASLLKELNCNFVRCSHYPQSPHFLDACDELGIMVWQEVAGWQFIGNASWQEHVVDDVRAMVIRDRSRPSVVLWGTQVNESPLEPELYTKTKAVAKELDDSRLASGTETSQNTTGWVADVFAYDDYHGTFGEATLLPPLTNVPYLITESVGALIGPHYFRWIDNQTAQQAQSITHAQVHNIAGGSDHYSGLLGWCAVDYASYNGYISNDMKTPGVMDTFRVFKPGAAFYRAQVDPAKQSIMEPAFFWDSSAASPVHSLGSNATIWSNCDYLHAYIGQKVMTLHPDRESFQHLKYPPFYLNVTDINATPLPDLRIDGYIGGRMVLSRKFSGAPAGDGIRIVLHGRSLTADGIDSTLIQFHAADKYGNIRSYAQGDVELSLEGPGVFINQSNATEGLKSVTTSTSFVFSFSTNGGVGGALLRTIAGKSGKITITASHKTMGHASATIEAI